MRIDRLLSVGCESRLYTQVRKPDDLGQAYIDNLAQFWVQYNALKDKRFKVLAVRGPKAAMATVRRGSVAGHTAGVD
jgi:inorganic pyrophosphatase